MIRRCAICCVPIHGKAGRRSRRMVCVFYRPIYYKPINEGITVQNRASRDSKVLLFTATKFEVFLRVFWVKVLERKGTLKYEFNGENNIV